MLNAVNFPDDNGFPRDAYFGIGFSKLDPHVWYSEAIKSLLLKLKVYSLKHMCFLEFFRVYTFIVTRSLLMQIEIH